jgi:hypothetical protein
VQRADLPQLAELVTSKNFPEEELAFTVGCGPSAASLKDHSFIFEGKKSFTLSGDVWRR